MYYYDELSCYFHFHYNIIIIILDRYNFYDIQFLFYNFVSLLLAVIVVII